MQPVRRIIGRAVPLDRADVDTDQIIPSRWLKRVERTGYGAGLFEDWRKDPGFELSQERYRGAAILVTGPNFGSGSSREHAVWALEDWGFRAIVSPRLADIFKSNCLKVGLVPVEVPAEVARRLIRAVQADPSLLLTVDVEARELRAPAARVAAPFPLDDHSRSRLLEGLDEVGLTLRHEDAIARHEGRRAEWLPRVSS